MMCIFLWYIFVLLFDIWHCCQRIIKRYIPFYISHSLYNYILKYALMRLPAEKPNTNLNECHNNQWQQLINTLSVSSWFLNSITICQYWKECFICFVFWFDLIWIEIFIYRIPRHNQRFLITFEVQDRCLCM